MNILTFLAANWDSVLIVVLLASFVIFLVAKKQWGLLDKMLFALITWAEREYGGCTGSLKLAAVIEKVYPHIPAVVRWFMSEAALQRMIEKALAKAKEQWCKYPAYLE